MSVTADTVRQLSEPTGAGMMECKKALVETAGNLDAAAELMRTQGLAKADKKATRVAAEGVIAIERAAEGGAAGMVEVNCETDFVAREHDFRAFAAEVARTVSAARPANLEALLAVVDARHVRGAGGAADLQYDGARLRSVARPMDLAAG